METYISQLKTSSQDRFFTRNPNFLGLRKITLFLDYSNSTAKCTKFKCFSKSIAQFCLNFCFLFVFTNFHVKNPSWVLGLSCLSNYLGEEPSPINSRACRIVISNGHEATYARSFNSGWSWNYLTPTSRPVISLQVFYTHFYCWLISSCDTNFSSVLKPRLAD